MQDDEITNFFIVRQHAAVVFPSQCGVAVAVWKVAQEKIHSARNHVYRCRLQRFDESGGKTDRQTIVFPKLSPVPCGEWDDSGIVEGNAAEAAHQRRFRSRIAAEMTRIHIALRHAILQGYLPAPARRLGRGASKGGQRFLAARLGNDGAVAWQIFRPIHGTDRQRLANQKPLETRAVDEKVTLNFAAIAKHHASDETVVPLLYPGHFALDARKAARLGVAAQGSGHRQRVDMQRVVRTADRGVAAIRQQEEAPIFSHYIAWPKICHRRRITLCSRPEPALIKVVGSDRSANDAEGMEVLCVALMPADKLDAQFVRSLGGANEVPFIDAEPLNQPDERWYGGFADRDCPDLFGFDQLDPAQLAFEVMAKHGRRQPPRSAAADDDDFGYGLHHQFRFSTSTPGLS